MEPRGIAELRHGEARGGAAEVVGRGSSCSSAGIGHVLLGDAIRVSVSDIGWAP